MPDLDEPFNGDTLDLATWLPHYLPAWSSRAASAATWAVSDSCLTLSIPPEQGPWCAYHHGRPELHVDVTRGTGVGRHPPRHRRSR